MNPNKISVAKLLCIFYVLIVGVVLFFEGYKNSNLLHEALGVASLAVIYALMGIGNKRANET